VRRTALTLLLLLAASCAPQELTLLSESELPEDVYGSPEPTPSISPLPRNGFIYLVHRGRLQRVRITFQEGEARSLPEALLSALFLQAAQEEDPRGTRTEIPEGTRLNGVRVAGAVATVDVSVEFEQAAPGVAQTLRIAQVVYTLTEEATGVTAVQFEIEGASLDSVPIGGEQVTRTSRAVTRDDYAQFDPDARPEEPED
jgi:hypothetical protein